MNFMKSILMMTVVVVLSLLLTCIPALAQTAPSGPCTNPSIGGPVMVVIATTVYYCPSDTLVWSQLPRLSAKEQTIASTNLHAQRMARAVYSFATDGGAIGAITPANNFTLPINAVITNVAINSTTAVTSLGSATVALGFTAGAGAASLVAATAKASLGANAFVQGIPVPQTASTWLKLTAAGQLSVTVAVAALTAGVIEVDIWYYVPLA